MNNEINCQLSIEIILWDWVSPRHSSLVRPWDFAHLAIWFHETVKQFPACVALPQQFWHPASWGCVLINFTGYSHDFLIWFSLKKNATWGYPSHCHASANMPMLAISVLHIIITRFWASKLRVRRRQRVSMCFPGISWNESLIKIDSCFKMQMLQLQPTPGRGHHSPGSGRAACAAAERSERGSPGLARRSAQLAAGQLRDPGCDWKCHGNFMEISWWSIW